MGRERDAPKRRALAEEARVAGGGNAKKVYGNGLYVISSQYLCSMKIRIRYDFHAEESKIPPPIALIYS